MPPTHIISASQEPPVHNQTAQGKGCKQDLGSWLWNTQVSLASHFSGFERQPALHRDVEVGQSPAPTLVSTLTRTSLFLMWQQCNCSAGVAAEDKAAALWRAACTLLL